MATCNDVNSLRGVIKYMQFQRIERALNDSIYLLDTNTHLGELKIAGTTKKVYTVKYLSELSCDCPDFSTPRNGHRYLCKHICFVLCKICKLYDPDIFNSLSLNEAHHLLLSHRLSSARLGSDIIDQDLVNRFARLTSKTDEEEKQEDLGSKTFTEDDECPICFDQLLETDTIECNTCHNHVHGECLKKWLLIQKKCVYCRSTIVLKKENKTVVDSRYIQL